MVDLITCGAINWDISLFMRRLPKTGEEVPVHEIYRVSGGTAANVSVAAARILGPGRVAFIGALGSDDIAERQLTILRDEGVDTSGILRVMEEESGQAYITIGAGGENEIHTYFGANLRLSIESLVEPERMKLIRGSKVVVIMDPPLETCRRLAGLCCENRLETVIWDPGIHVENGFKSLSSTIEHIDYFILNHHEFENLFGTSEPEQVGARLEAVNREIKAIIKHGQEGCALCEDGGKKITHIDAVPIKRMGLDVVNTVGCGDAFIGAFASAKVLGLDDVEALRWGNVAGAYKATRMETRGGPTLKQLEDLLRKWLML